MKLAHFARSNKFEVDGIAVPVGAGANGATRNDSAIFALHNLYVELRPWLVGVSRIN